MFLGTRELWEETTAFTHSGAGGGGKADWPATIRCAGTPCHKVALQLDGVLKSWAVPRGPPVESGIRRLAVEVEDHPVDYITFKGTIPKGEYGAGTVKIWDKGTFRLKTRTDNMYEFWLNGKRLKGKYALIRFKEKNWLIFKTKTED